MEKREPICTLGGNVNWYSHDGEQYGIPYKEKKGYRMLWAGALGWPREMIWGGWWEGASGLGTHVHLCWIQVNVWQNQYSIKINLKKRQLGIKLPCDPTVQLLGIYPEKTIIEKDTGTPMFITALFIITETWKLPRCSSTEEWIKKFWYIYIMQYWWWL